MTVLRNKITLLFVIMVLTSCAWLPEKYQPAVQPPQGAGDKLLVKGIQNYEEGEYKNAVKNLQDALKAGLSRKTDSAKAHKYLAFIACGSNNTKKCSDEFQRAFEDDPNFSLSAAEAGHPVWGPVYLKVQKLIKSKSR